MDNFIEVEAKFCKENDIDLEDYIIIKEKLIRDKLHQGYVDKEEFIDSFNLKNKSILSKIYDIHKEFNLIIEN